MEDEDHGAEYKFIGRKKPIKDLVELIVTKERRLICIDGEPGIGVSRFAEFSLGRVAQQQHHTCFLIDCQKIPGKTKEEVEANFKTYFEEDVIQKTAGKSTIIFDSSDRLEMINDLVKQFSVFLQHNQESHVNLLFDNVDRKSKDIVQSFVISALKSFKKKIKNVTFILTSRMKLSFAQLRMESVKIGPFTKEEVEEYFREIFDISFRDDVFRIIHGWCAGNVTVMSLVGRELTDLKDMSFDQEDFSTVIVQGSSQDALRLVNSDGLADQEKWSEIFAKFFEQLSRRAQVNLQKVAQFDRDFKAEDLNKMRPNESVALTKHRVLVELMRTNAIRHNLTDKTFQFDQLKRQWLDTQESGPDEDQWLDPSNPSHEDEVQNTKTDPFSESIDDNTKQPLKTSDQAGGNAKTDRLTVKELLRQRNMESEWSLPGGSNESTDEPKSKTPDVAGPGPLEPNVTFNIVASDNRPVASSTPYLCQSQGCVNLRDDRSPKEKLPERFKDISIKPSNLDSGTNGFEGRSVDLQQVNGHAYSTRRQHMLSESSAESFENNELQPTTAIPFTKSASIQEQDEPQSPNAVIKDKRSPSVDGDIPKSSSQHGEQTPPCRMTQSSWANVPSPNDRIESQTLVKSTPLAVMSNQPREPSKVQGCDHEEFISTSAGPFAMTNNLKAEAHCRNLQKQDAVDDSHSQVGMCVEKRNLEPLAQKTGPVMGRRVGGEQHSEGHPDLASGMRHNTSYFASKTPATVQPPPDPNFYRGVNRTDEGAPATLLPRGISSRIPDTSGAEEAYQDTSYQDQQFVTHGNMPFGAQNIQNSSVAYVQPIQCTSGGLSQGYTPSEQWNVQFPGFDQSAISPAPPNQLFQPSSADGLQQPVASEYQQQVPLHRPPCPGRAVTLNSQHYPGNGLPLNTQSHSMRGVTWNTQAHPGRGGQGHRHVQQQSSTQLFNSEVVPLSLHANEDSAFPPDSAQSHPIASFPNHTSIMMPFSTPQNQHRAASSESSSIRLRPRGPQGPRGPQFGAVASQPLQHQTQNTFPSIYIHPNGQQQQQQLQQQQQQQQQQYYYPQYYYLPREMTQQLLMGVMQPESAAFINHQH